jgi:hypothetical protein
LFEIKNDNLNLITINPNENELYYLYIENTNILISKNSLTNYQNVTNSIIPTENKIYSISYDYRGKRLLGISKKNNNFYLVQIIHQADSLARIVQLYLLPIDFDHEDIVVCSFHHFKKIHYSVILTEKRVLVLDIGRSEIIANSFIPFNLIFDSIQINTDIFY